MNHLLTEAERKSRWHCETLWPRYLPVLKAEQWQDLLNVPPQTKQKIRSAAFEQQEKTTHLQLSREELLDYDFVYSVPFEWLSTLTFNTDRDAMDISFDNLSATTNSDYEGFEPPLPKNLLRRVLEIHGFVVVSGVLTDSECFDALGLAWHWIEAASVAERHVQEHRIVNKDSDDNKTVASSVFRSEPLTNSGTAYFPRSVEGGIMPFYGSGHSSFAWKIRSHPAVQQVFTALLQAPPIEKLPLVSSLDGIVLWTAADQNPTDTGWFHIDQNPQHKPGATAVQGLVNLLPVTENTGGNALVVQSHYEFANEHYIGNCNRCSSIKNNTNNNDKPTMTKGTQSNIETKENHGFASSSGCDHPGDDQSSARAFYKQRLLEVGSDDWLEIDPNDRILLHPSRIVTLLLGTGDMLLWDSRVAHCSYPARSEWRITAGNGTSNDNNGQPNSACPQKASTPTGPANTVGVSDEVETSSVHCQRQDQNKGFLRAATLVSMVPASTISKTVLRLRRDAVDCSRTLSHWVDKVAPLGEERTDDAALERACVDFMKAQQRRESCCSRKTKIIYEWVDLSDEQKRLVVGNLRDGDR